MKLKLAFAAALALGGSIAATPAAVALPLAPLQNGAAPPTQDIGWRCGPGWHVGPYGRCVPNRPPVYGPRPGWRCGPGFHPGPYGRCVPNRRW